MATMENIKNILHKILANEFLAEKISPKQIHRQKKVRFFFKESI